MKKPEDLEAIANCETFEARDERSSGETDSTQASEGVSLEDFHAFMPSHSYIFAPTREMWPASSVNARIPDVELKDANGAPLLDKKGKPVTITASAWLDKNRPVEQMTWVPGLPGLIRDQLISEGGFISRPNVTIFNLYLPPVIDIGDPERADPWVSHLRKIYPDSADHIIAWLAHRVQRPGEKINHALVLGGHQGIGKDTLLEPVKHAVGPWNFLEVSPTQVLGRFNGFVKSVILRVSEARDLGEIDRYAFHEHLKPLIAAPPDVTRVDEKNLREHSVVNVCGVIITTNHKTDGIYLTADDRRHYVAWSDATKEDFDTDYWNRLYKWFAKGGTEHVAAFLHAYDLTRFDPKAPPPKTSAFWEIVDANRAPEDAELADALDALGSPDTTTLERISNHAAADLFAWLKDRKNRRTIRHRLEDVGYVPVRNPTAKDGLWKRGGRREVIYARKDLSIRARIEAATSMLVREVK